MANISGKKSVLVPSHSSCLQTEPKSEPAKEPQRWVDIRKKERRNQPGNLGWSATREWWSPPKPARRAAPAVTGSLHPAQVRCGCRWTQIQTRSDTHRTLTRLCKRAHSPAPRRWKEFPFSFVLWRLQGLVMLWLHSRDSANDCVLLLLNGGPVDPSSEGHLKTFPWLKLWKNFPFRAWKLVRELTRQDEDFVDFSLGRDKRTSDCKQTLVRAFFTPARWGTRLWFYVISLLNNTISVHNDNS